jgi:hypothetical protein
VKKIKKIHIQKIRSANKLNPWQIIIFGAIFAVIGAFFIFSSHAAGPTSSLEAENSNTTSPAATVSDAQASGGSALKLQAAGSSSCLVPKYPTPTCTGVPGGTTFTNTINGNYDVTSSGQVIDGWHIKGDLTILANNTTVKNTEIDGKVDNQGNGEIYYSYTITDSTIGPPGACTNLQGRSCNDANSNSTTNCAVSPGLGSGNYTATRIYDRGHDDGFRVSGPNVTVQDSYFYACYVTAAIDPPDGSHSDGVQTFCSSCANIHLLHNTLDLSGVPATFPINLGDLNQSNVTINDNLLVGGQNYLMQVLYRGGPIWTVNNNRLVKDTWLPNAPWPRTDGAITANGTCSGQSWSGNTVVTIDSNYNITSTVGNASCVD